jgi:hypothetical protein
MSISSQPVSAYQVEDFGETLVVNSTFMNGNKDEYVYPTNGNLNATMIIQGTPSSEFLISYNRSYLDIEFRLVKTTIVSPFPVLSAGGLTPDAVVGTPQPINEWYGIAINPNLYSLFKQARLYLSSTQVESVNDVGHCVDAKVSLMGKDSVETCFSQSYLMPINTYHKGCPPLLKNMVGISNTSFSRARWSGDNRILGAVPFIYDQRALLDTQCASLQNHPSFFRTQKLANLNNANMVRYLDAAQGLNDGFPADPTGGAMANVPSATIRCKLFLGVLFGFVEKDAFLPPSQFQIQLDRGSPTDIYSYTQYADNVLNGLEHEITSCKLVLVQKKATSEALAFYDSDKVFAVNHYSLLTNNMVGSGGSMSITTSGGINWFCMSFQNSGNFMSWDKIPPSTAFQFYINYRAQQTPMNVEGLAMPSLNPLTPLGFMSPNHDYGFMPPDSESNTKTYFEHYAGFKGEYSMNYMGNGVLYNQADFCKSQFRVYFDLIPGLTNSTDTASGPLQLFFNSGNLNTLNAFAVGAVPIPQINTLIVICRTNLVKYSSNGYIFSLVTNGSG